MLKISQNKVVFFTIAFILTMFLFACGSETKSLKSGENKEPTKTVETETVKKDIITGGDVSSKNRFNGSKRHSLLITQSQFLQNDEGKYIIPGAAVLLILTPDQDGNKWKTERIEDPDSNVFHKAIQYGKEGILTIGANEAKLKLWNKSNDKWTSKTLWHPTFGGKHNRLRDIELADFDGDGVLELAIATHDQGVVAVVWHKDGKWKAEEIDRKENTFVHEIEVGDLDADGKMEFYATPSEPNTASGHGQGGGIIKYAWTGEKFKKSTVVSYKNRHIKEILVADLDGDKKQELYAALEAQMGQGGKIEIPVEIVRFDWKDGKYQSTKVVQLQDRFCRFLTVGDIDGDGQNEMIAAAFSSGVWVIEKNGDKYISTCIDKKSGGFEHSAYLADVDGNGQVELYIGDDKSGSIKQHIYVNENYLTKIINKRLVPAQAMVWNITLADL